ncbi:aspartate aminotransferase family protein [Bacillus piscicola]|uniref:aminotransferase family protein n=1 Tax=Bacillus piscicola TaxID=1632684 RepID=UPI001F08B4C0|nr:aspartate aminotransferase family protein [Bacillus piscicola]
MQKAPVKNQLTHDLEQLDVQHYLHPTSIPGQLPKMIFESGDGIYVKNTDGDSYIDGISMLWNVNLGHGNKELGKAAQEQMDKIAFASSFAGYSNEPAIRLTKKLADWTPEGLNTVFYTSGGSEANDTAFKLARLYWQLKEQPKKTKFISFVNGYHGVTIGAGTATTIPGFHRFAGTEMPEVYHATAHLTECEKGDRSHPDFEKSARHLIETEGADTIAGIIIEPVQGSGGVYMPPEGYIEALRDLCDEFDILFIADEVINGFCRTGEKFAVDHWDVVPDLMSLAKGITSGYAQLGAVMIHDKVKEVINTSGQVMAHGFTYSGHPMACAVGIRNLEIMEEMNLVNHVKEMEKVLNKGLAYLEEKHATVGLTRNKGLMGAFELFEDSASGKRFAADKKAGLQYVEDCFQKNLILRALGAADGKAIIALAPPLVITKPEIEKMVSIMDDALVNFQA